MPRLPRIWAPCAAAILAGLAGLAGLAASCGDAPPERPAPDHVLLVVIDTLRADHLGVLGHDPETSPGLDALAREGVLFERAISQCSWTAPSMISLMTGRWIAGDRLDVPFAPGSETERLPTIATSFAAAGWRTAAFIYNDIISEENGYGAGFEVFSQHVPYEPNDPIVAWLEEHAGERTFTYVHLNEPHDPYESPPEWQRVMLDPPPVGPERRARFERWRTEFDLPAIDDSVAAIERGAAGYVDDVHFSDQRVAGLVAELERLGVLDRTAIVVTADHGEGLWTRPAYASGDRAAAAKQGQAPTLANTLKMKHGNQLYPELVHVPLILCAPGLPGGARVPALVENVDLWPTLLELCDLPAPGRLDGRSLLVSIDAPERWRDDKPAAFSATRFAVTAISQDGWQLVVPTELGECLEGLGIELYDLGADPGARTNVAAEHPDIVRRLEELALERAARGLAPGIDAGVLRANLDTLEALGYVGGIIDTGAADYADFSIGGLLEVLGEAADAACLRRLYAARALGLRVDELSAAELEALRALRVAERSQAVRRELDLILDRG